VKTISSFRHCSKFDFELRFYIPLDKNRSLANTEETKCNTKARIHLEHKNTTTQNKYKTRMWANAQRDGRPAEYR